MVVVVVDGDFSKGPLVETDEKGGIGANEWGGEKRCCLKNGNMVKQYQLWNHWILIEVNGVYINECRRHEHDPVTRHKESFGL